MKYHTVDLFILIQKNFENKKKNRNKEIKKIACTFMSVSCMKEKKMETKNPHNLGISPGNIIT